MVQTVTCLHSCSNNHRWSPLEELRGLFLFVSEHRYNSEVSENRPTEHKVSSLEQHDFDKFLKTSVISHNTHEIWSSFKIWTWISAFFVFWRFVVEFVAWSRLRLCTQRWITAVLLAKFRPSWWEHKFNLYVFNVHLCWFELLTASNRYKLWIWRSFVPGDGPPVVCARGRPQLDASGENTAPELWCFVSFRHRLMCALFKSSWYTHPRLQNSWLSWRYLNFYKQSSCKIRILRFLSLARSVRARQELLVNLEFRESPGHENNLHEGEELFSSITGSLAMYSCPISTVLANSACSEALWVSVSRFAVRVSSESLKLVICSAPFCVINVNCSGVEVYLLFLLPNFPGASTKDSGSHNCRYIVGCLPAWSGWQSQCFHMCLGSGKFFLLSSSVQAVMVPSLEILNVKCDTRMCQPSAMRSCPIVLGFSLRCPFYHVFSDANSQEAPVFWLELCPKCCHFFGIVQTNFDIAFVCRINVVEHRHEIWSYLQWILDFASSDMSEYASCRREWKHLVVRAKWITLLGLPNSIFGKSMFIPSAIQFCCPSVGWIWIWDSNTQRRIWEHVNFHPDQLCCCITQQRNAWTTKCLPILRYLHVVCSCAFDQCLHLPLHGLH